MGLTNLRSGVVVNFIFFLRSDADEGVKLTLDYKAIHLLSVSISLCVSLVERYV